MVISTGMTLPRWVSVAALYCLTKSMILTPCGPSAVPTGGAGVAAPAFSCTLTTAAIFFFLGAIYLGPYLDGLAWHGTGSCLAALASPGGVLDQILLT